MMGSGKSTVGRMVADRVGVPFYDTDVMVIERARASIPEIWEELGEPGFRRMESTEVMAVPKDGVIAAAGGGAVLAPANRTVMARADHIVWLRCDPSILAKRLRDGGERPLLARSPESVLETLLTERAPIYDELATSHVDTSGMTIEQVVNEVVEIWRS